MKPPSASQAPDDPPGVPGFRTWRGVYGFVIAFFGLCVFLLVVFERTFA